MAFVNTSFENIALPLELALSGLGDVLKIRILYELDFNPTSGESLRKLSFC